MYLIIGLGNPEEEYARTRHNMGFDTINSIALKYNISVEKKKFDALYTDTIIEKEKVILVKPQTYMNSSGISVKQFVQFYKIPMENIIVIYDDMDIDKGIIKIRKKGGPGSHNGMKSVVQEISSDAFPRIRVGIGLPEHKNDMINYVIGNVPKEEYDILHSGVEKAADAVIDILKNGIDHAMNEYN
jgi:PTH1 family peptidyl-tRNA hydrolase